MMRTSDHQYDHFYSALVTPYVAGTTEVDIAQLRSLARYHIESAKGSPVRIGLIVNPEAGEVFYLTREEKAKSVAAVVDETDSEVPVFAGVAGFSVPELIEQGRDAIAAGATGLFVLPPMGSIDVSLAWDAERYPEVWIWMLQELISEVGDVPLIAHPLGAKASEEFGAGVPASAAKAICSEVENIVGWKLTYPPAGARKVIQALNELPHHVGSFVANGLMFDDLVREGLIHGAVSGAFNYAVDPMVKHLSALAAGNPSEAEATWQTTLKPLHSYIFADISRLHVRFKIATWLRGVIESPAMRRPMPPPMESEIETIRELIALPQQVSATPSGSG